MAGLLLAKRNKAALFTGAVFAFAGCERRAGEVFFDTGKGGGDPVWFQHLIWFIGHPEVFLPILAFLIICGVFFFRKKPD